MNDHSARLDLRFHEGGREFWRHRDVALLLIILHDDYFVSSSEFLSNRPDSGVDFGFAVQHRPTRYSDFIVLL
ncbi:MULTISPECIES: hypothetical protein [Pandoraea]|uniref:hypothetical protein n=1 Tax=Pandoraea TaxID=93217 RepID=UPI0015827730|nr:MULTISPECIES: hypothetical protein [Pandoraea]